MNGWQKQGIVSKRDRIEDLLLGGHDYAQIARILHEERGCQTTRAEVSRVRARKADGGMLPRQSHPVMADGVQYKSISEAARANGISTEAARKRLINDRFEDWKRLPNGPQRGS